MALIDAPWAAPTLRSVQRWPDEAGVALHPPRAALVRLERRLRGQLVLPGSAAYETALGGAGGAAPRVIVFCEDEQDVRLCLAFAQEHRLEVACRAGGHSFAGYSQSNGLVIDISRIDDVEVSVDRALARVGAGITAGKLDQILDQQGRHVPSGTCPEVGVAGFVQGGGYGITSRMFGMSCDSVVAVRMMLADGRTVVADATRNHDLFWAVRGGTGGNLGVLLEISYRLTGLGTMWGFCLRWPLDRAARALTALQAEHTGPGPTRLGLLPVLATLRDGAKHLVVFGVYDGSPSDGLAAIDGLRAIDPELLLDERGRYAALNASAMGSVLLGTAPATARLVARSGYVARPLARADWQRVVEAFAATPCRYDVVWMEPYGAAINARPPEECAFVHRRALANVVAVGFGQDGSGRAEADALRWCETVLDAVPRQSRTGHVYQNYPVPGLADYRWAYFGDAFNSLLFVKRKYDPGDFFGFEQMISDYPPPATPGITRSARRSQFRGKRIVYS